MGNFHFELDEEGVKELLQSAEMQAVCLEYAQAVAGRVGDGYTADVQVGRSRAIARISAATDKANRDNVENNTLLKAMG